jgi:hypothetical protein
MAVAIGLATSGCETSTGLNRPEFAPLPRFVQSEAERPPVAVPRRLSSGKQARTFVRKLVRSDRRRLRALRQSVKMYNAHREAFGR